MYGKQQALKKYRRNRIETAQPGQLILMVYDGIISCLGNAKQALTPAEGTPEGSAEGHNKDINVVNENMIKAQRLLQELQLSLDTSVDELGPMLEELYEALQYQLLEANIKKDVEMIDEIAEQFAELRDAWGEVVLEAARNGGAVSSGPMLG